MKTTQLRILGAIATLLAVAATALPAQAPQAAPRPADSATAVNLVRLVNTSEMLYFYGTAKDANDGHKSFATWQQLWDSGIAQKEASTPMFASLTLSAGPEAIPGYRLDVLVSTDGKAYSIALHDTRQADHLFSVFSDQNGVIFLGSPLQ